MRTRQPSSAGRRTGWRVLSVLCVVAVAFASVWRLASNVAAAAPGDLDTSFGTAGDGKVPIEFGLTNDFGTFNAVALYPGGKILAAGTRNAASGATSRFLLARFNPNGELDITFNSPNGIVATEFATPNTLRSAAHAVAVLDDGRIVVAGGTGATVDNSSDFALARYHPDGSLDTSFDSDGKVSTDFFGFTDVALDIVVQPDQKVIAVSAAPSASSTRR